MSAREVIEVEDEGDEENEENDDEEEEEEEEPGGSAGYGRHLMNALERVERPGSFCIGEKIKRYVLPGLTIPGVGRVGLPLSSAQAKEIISQCSLAPFGRKEETIYDTSVRNTWQLNPSAFALSNPEWSEITNSIVPLVKVGLGLNENMQVHLDLYKLLLYEQGGFFKPHRDTEKVQGMFGTLSVILQSEYQGGQLAIRHNGEEKIYDFSGTSADDLHFIAFYGDCEHEIKTVTKGYRLALVYNLVYSGNAIPPVPANNSESVANIQFALKKWATYQTPSKYAIVLDHKYSQAGLSLAGLKGSDKARADVLRAAIAEMPKGKRFKMALGIIQLSESGAASGGYRGDYDMEDGERTLEIKHVLDLDGKPVGTREFSGLSEDQVLPVNFFEDWEEWDDEKIEEATGNEGASMERWYKTAVIFVWPKSNQWAMKIEDSYGAAIAEFRQKIATKPGKNAHAIGLAFLGRQYTVKYFPDLVECFIEMNDDLLLEELFERQAPKIDMDIASKIASAIVKASARLGWQSTQPFVMKIIQQAIRETQSSGYYYYSESSYQKIVNFLCELSSHNFPQNSVESKMCIDIADSVIQNWKVYSAPTRSHGNTKKFSTTTKFAEALANIKNVELAEKFLMHAGMDLLENEDVGPALVQLCAGFDWTVLEASLVGLFEAMLKEHPTKAAETVAKLQEAASSNPHLLALCSAFATKLVELCTTKPQLQQTTLNVLFAILLRMDDKKLVLQFLPHIDPIARASQVLVGSLVTLCTKFGLSECLPLVFPMFKTAKFAEIMQLLQAAWPIPPASLAFPGDQEKANALKPFIVLATQQQISTAEKNYLVLFYKLAHLINEDAALDKISNQIASQITSAQTENLFFLVTTIWKWMGELQQKLYLPWFVQLYTALLNQAHAEYTRLHGVVDWNLQVKPTCKCNDCASFTLFCNHATREEYQFAAGQQRRFHVEQQIKAMNIDVYIRTTTKTTGNPHTLVCTKIGTAQKKRLDFLHSVVTSLNAIVAKNVHARDNEDPSQANKKLKTEK